MSGRLSGVVRERHDQFGERSLHTGSYTGPRKPTRKDFWGFLCHSLRVKFYPCGYRRLHYDGSISVGSGRSVDHAPSLQKCWGIYGGVAVAYLRFEESGRDWSSVEISLKIWYHKLNNGII